MLSLSGTNPLPLAASLLPESFLPEFLCRAAAFWGSSFLWRLVVSCTKTFMTSVFRQCQHCFTDTVFSLFCFLYRNATTLISFWKNWSIPCQKWCHRCCKMTVFKLISTFSSLQREQTQCYSFALSSLSLPLTWRHLYSRLVENNVTPIRAELLVFLMSAAVFEVQGENWCLLLLDIWQVEQCAFSPCVSHFAMSQKKQSIFWCRHSFLCYKWLGPNKLCKNRHANDGLRWV